MRTHTKVSLGSHSWKRAVPKIMSEKPCGKKKDNHANALELDLNTIDDRFRSYSFPLQIQTKIIITDVIMIIREMVDHLLMIDYERRNSI